MGVALGEGLGVFFWGVWEGEQLTCHNVHSRRLVRVVLRCWVRRSCSVSGEHDLDLEVAFDRSSQGFVPRKESGSEAFGQGDVGGVVSGEVGPELEDASEQALVP